MDLFDNERLANLDRAIDHCGIELGKFDKSDKCLRKVMSAIGAKHDDEDFIRDRIALRVRTQDALTKADNLIDRTTEMLNRFKENDKVWEQMGKDVDFDIWNK